MPTKSTHSRLAPKGPLPPGEKAAGLAEKAQAQHGTRNSSNRSHGCQGGRQRALCAQRGAQWQPRPGVLRGPRLGRGGGTGSEGSLLTSVLLGQRHQPSLGAGGSGGQDPGPEPGCLTGRLGLFTPGNVWTTLTWKVEFPTHSKNWSL